MPESAGPTVVRVVDIGNTRLRVALRIPVVRWTSAAFARFIRQPTLILTGTDDPIVPPVNGHIMRRLLPNAELHLFDDGHLGLITNSATLTPPVQKFLGRA